MSITTIIPYRVCLFYLNLVRYLGNDEIQTKNFKTKMFVRNGDIMQYKPSEKNGGSNIKVKFFFSLFFKENSIFLYT